MQINDHSSCRKNSPFARALASVLLIGIIYAITFGAVHSHQNVSSGVNTNLSTNTAEQASFSSGVPFHNHSNNDECLICVLHQQLFNSIVHAPVFIVESPAQIAFVSAPTVLLYNPSPITTRPIVRLSGRAPPLG